MKPTVTERITAYLQHKPALARGVAGLLAFGAVWAMPWMLQLSGNRLEFTNSILSVLVFASLFFTFIKIIDTGFMKRKRGWLWPVLTGILFSCCMVFGTQLELEESVSFRNTEMWFAIIILAAVFTLVVRLTWDRLYGWLKQPVGTEKKLPGKSGLGSWLVTAGVILVCYLPVFLAVYPGFFVYDAYEEYIQVATENFSTHHPLIHVLLLGNMIQWVHGITGSYNAGIACYTILQMLVMAGIFSWCVCKLRGRGLPGWGCIAWTLYFGLCPVLVMFSLCSAKDGLFTGMLLIMVILLQELCRAPEDFFHKKGSVVLFATASLGMMLLRHNGFYGFLVFVPVLVFYLRKSWKRVLVYLIGIVLLYGLLNAGLTAWLHADASENQEMLTVPISQMARVYSYENNSLTTEDKEILERFLPEKALKRYTPKITDSVKIDFNNQAYAADPGAFWKLWVKLGIEHPFAYINAWFMTSYGFWYPDTIIDSYRGNTVFTYTYEDSSYFGFEVEEPGHRDSKIPWLEERYRQMSLEITQQKIPVVSMLFSPGFLFWVMVFVLGYWCYAGFGNRVIPFLLPLLCFLTVLLGPACLVRYVVFWWVLIPVVISELLLSRGTLGTGVGIENREQL